MKNHFFNTHMKLLSFRMRTEKNLNKLINLVRLFAIAVYVPCFASDIHFDDINYLFSFENEEILFYLLHIIDTHIS